MTNILLAILFLPILSAAAITLFTLRRPTVSAGISIGSYCLTFILSLLLYRGAVSQGLPLEISFTWLSVGTLTVELGFLVDRLSLLMLLVVTGIGSLIHIYSKGYMQGDPSNSRYFAGLSIFMFSMTGIVLANNLLMIFIFWEMVGLSSYLLIGFWMAKPSAADAGKKAFLCNRVGDTGFLLGIIILWSILGTLGFSQIDSLLAANPAAMGSWTTLVGLLLFCGVVGKSAQFPLHVWLPDAMEGPTPVSALIHAATMVAAGVYLLARAFAIFSLPAAWPESLAWLNFSALDAIAFTGALTALLAALIAVQQNDIKRILAYSTLSQLGYMVMAVGIAYPAAGMFHLTTHAFFKALLFLGAGSVIVALHHEQDIWKMGGLQKRMPITFYTFLIGTLALCGIPPLSGFFSKDAIIAGAFSKSICLGSISVVVAFLTTFYMGRLFFVAFMGKARSQSAEKSQETPPVMTYPLILLAIAALFAGFWNVDTWMMRHYNLEPEAVGWFAKLLYPFKHAPMAALLSLTAVACGAVLAYKLYYNAKQDALPSQLGSVARWLKDKFYLDELYENTLIWCQDKFALVCDKFDRWIIGGALVGTVSHGVELVGRLWRLSQTGSVQTYAAIFVFGFVLLAYWVINW